ncbi:MAG: DUF4402 domain-containing protein [Pseudomonadota bacterium]
MKVRLPERPNLLILALMLGSWPEPSTAQETATAQGRAQTRVVAPVSTALRDALSFGSISVSAGASGTVTVSSDSTTAFLGVSQAHCTGQTKCRAHRAVFEVTGEAERTYGVSLPPSVVARGERSGSALAVEALEMRSLNTSARSGGRLDKAGKDRFFVGGTVNVPAGTVSDVYRAELPVTVFYN